MVNLGYKSVKWGNQTSGRFLQVKHLLDLFHGWAPHIAGVGVAIEGSHEPSMDGSFGTDHHGGSWWQSGFEGCQGWFSASVEGLFL